MSRVFVPVFHMITCGRWLSAWPSAWRSSGFRGIRRSPFPGSGEEGLMKRSPEIVMSGTGTNRQCCHCGRDLGEEQWAVYKDGAVLWACTSACRGNYHNTVGDSPLASYEER